MSKPILCLDFDGVCHSYVSGWQGADVIPDPPVDGLFEFLDEAREYFDIQIFSSRSNQPGGINAMWRWFGEHWSEHVFHKSPRLKEAYSAFMCPDWLSFPTEKPAAFLTIDDRAITFKGKWPAIGHLRNFKPWYK
jgi:hypothetical protein